MQKIRCGICLIISFLFCFLINCTTAVSLSAKSAEATGVLSVHFIDVGQGDSTFIEFPDGKTMLIDGGNTEYGDDVVKYLDNLNISTIDYVVATHSDTDHIGGLIEVLKQKDVLNVYRPFDICRTQLESGFIDELFTMFGAEYPSSVIVDNEIYANFLQCVYNEKVNGVSSNICVSSNKEQIVSTSDFPYLIKFFNPVAGDKFTTSRINVGYKVNLTEDQNTTSAVVGIFTEKQKYLFMADFTTEEEVKLIARLTDIEKDQLSSVSVLKVAHHGSKYSSSKSFLNLVKPKYSVISVGENDYGHPTNETIERLTNAGSIIYRTDTNGTIIFEEFLGELSLKALGKETKSSSNIAIIIILSVVTIGIILMVIFYKPIVKFITKKRIGKIK